MTAREPLLADETGTDYTDTDSAYPKKTPRRDVVGAARRDD